MSEQRAENAQKSDDRRYLDALSENGSFGDVLNFAYELLGRFECVAPPARTLTVWCSSCLPGRPCFVHEEDGGLPPVTEPVNPPETRCCASHHFEGCTDGGPGCCAHCPINPTDDEGASA